MLYFLEQTDNYVKSLEDLEGTVSEDIYQAIQGLHKEELEELEGDVEHYKYEKEFYEERLDFCKAELNDMQNLLNTLSEYLITSKRIDRRKINDIVKDLQIMTKEAIDC